MKMILDKQKVDEAFDTCLTQGEIFTKLYKLVFPDWDRIKCIDGYPEVSRETNDYLFKRFIRFDSLNHPTVISGGLWMNQGFSSYENNVTKDWVVSTDNCVVGYKDPQPEFKPLTK